MSLNVLMSKEMILAILVIAVAFGTESEFKLRIGRLCAAAHCALMPGHSLWHHPGTLLEISAPLNLLGTKVTEFTCLQIKDKQVDKLKQDDEEQRIIALNKSCEDRFVAEYDRIKYSEVLYLYRNNEHQ